MSIPNWIIDPVSPSFVEENYWLNHLSGRLFSSLNFREVVETNILPQVSSYHHNPHLVLWEDGLMFGNLKQPFESVVSPKCLIIIIACIPYANFISNFLHIHDLNIQVTICISSLLQTLLLELISNEHYFHICDHPRSSLSFDLIKDPTEGKQLVSRLESQCFHQTINTIQDHGHFLNILYQNVSCIFVQGNIHRYYSSLSMIVFKSCKHPSCYQMYTSSIGELANPFKNSLQ